MSEWKEYKLGDIVTFQRGHDLPKTKMTGGIYPVVGSNSIIGFHNEFTTKGPGITIGRSGTIGNPTLQKGDFWAHNTTLYVKEFKKVCPVFFYYLLKTLDFSLLNSGSAVPSLNRNFIHPFKVIIPETTKTQTAIAEILSSLDDKIKLNNAINKNLEDLAQALFKQWFVDFEFPDENGERYQSSGGEMVASELGMIPKGWEVLKLAELIKVTGGGTPKRSNGDYWNGDIPWFSIKDIPNESQVVIIDTVEKISDLGLKNSSTKILPIGTTIITARGTVGKIGLTVIKMAMNQSCYGINGIEGIGPYFNYYNLKQTLSILQRNSHGAVFDTITTSTFSSVSIAFSGMKLASIFDEMVKYLIDQISTNVKQNRRLISLRDTLLPKLISGELSINQAEEMINNIDILITQ